MSEEQKVPAPPPQINESTLVNCLKIVIIALFVYPLVYYTLINGNQEQEHSLAVEIQENSVENSSSTPEPVVRRLRIIKQPQCPVSHVHQVILQELCQELLVKRTLCTPADVHNLEKHKMPSRTARNNTSSEPRGTIVGCIAAGLLLTSLGAAILELYRAKSQTAVKSNKTASASSRKCSLADLTVLKHSRKELVRRESILEVHESTNAGKRFRPPPLNRRCSFPVGPSALPITESNIASLSNNPSIALIPSRRPSIVEPRRLSIIESRRNSIVSVLDGRKQSISIEATSATPRLSISVDNESPERRHWSRLVHRH